MIDIKKLEAEVLSEVDQEDMKRAKETLKLKLKQIQSAENVLRNLKREYTDLLARVGDGSL